MLGDSKRWKVNSLGRSFSIQKREKTTEIGPDTERDDIVLW